MLLMGKGKILGLLAGLLLLQGGALHVAKQPEPDREPVKWTTEQENSEDFKNVETTDTGSWMREEYERLGEEEAAAAASLEELEEQTAAGDGTEETDAVSDLSGELRNIRTQKMVLRARMEETGVGPES